MSSLTLVYVCNQELMLNNQLTFFDFNVDSTLHVAHLGSFRWGGGGGGGGFSLRKRTFWRLDHAKPARIIGLGNARAKMSLEIAHVSLFAGYGDLEAASTVEPLLSGPLLSGHPLLSGQFSKSRKLLLLMNCNFDLY